MKYGKIAGNQCINACIYEMFEQLDPTDVPTFVRKFRSERDPQRSHSFRELVVGSHLRAHAISARYGHTVHGKTPDWVIYDSAGQLQELVDVVSLHQRRETETDMVGTLSAGAIWTGWPTIPPDHLSAKINHKTHRYANLVRELSKPYTVFLFGEFLACVDPEEIEYVLYKHHGGLFLSVPTQAGLAYFTESAGSYKYTYYSNGGADFASHTIPKLIEALVAA